MSSKIFRKCLISGISAIFLVFGCAEKPAKTIVREADGAKTEIIIPQGITAAELITLQTLTANALILRADQQTKAHDLAKTQIQAKQEAVRRRDWLIFALFMAAIINGAVLGLVTILLRGGRK